METYYKGEDVSLNLALFENLTLEDEIDIGIYEIAISIYNPRQEIVIYAATRDVAELGALPIKRNEDNTISLIITHEKLETLECGLILFDAMLISKVDSRSKIVKNPIFNLEDSRVKRMQCFLK